MIRSERISQISRIMRAVKEEIYLYPYQVFSKKEFNSIINEKITMVAKELDIKRSSAADKVSRQLDNISMSEFKKELWDFFIDNVPADKTSLGERVLQNITKKDDKESVKNMLNSVKYH